MSNFWGAVQKALIKSQDLTNAFLFEVFKSKKVLLLSFLTVSKD